MKRYILFLTCFAIFTLCAKQSLAQDKIDFYKSKYKVYNLYDKIVDNHGNGYDSLYGARNMRVILYGVAYRGGANNVFNKIEKRDNHNPLQDSALQNLANQGFSKAIYLYGTNFGTAKKTFVSKTANDTLHYIQNSGSTRESLKKIMSIIYEAIKNPKTGPIYLHCWNGWHQSGYVSSAILIQFCGFSNKQAYDYWIKNTDGVNKGYDRVKSQVLEFKAFDEFKIDKQTQEKICPCVYESN